MAEGRFSYGGQAVIEGVMIRGRKGYATALRLANGEIEVHQQPWVPLTQRHRLLRLPIIRGTPALIDALVVGYRTLMLSADRVAQGEGIKPPTTFQYGLSIAAALAIAIGGFVLLPSAVTPKIATIVLRAVAPKVATHFLLLNLMEGVIRLIVFVLFLLGVSFMPDMRRVFQYHGAEHKVINAFEERGAYQPQEAQKYRTLHPRCGTSFIFTVLVVGILVHAVVRWPSLWLRLAWRLALLPVVAGLSYELIKLAGAHRSSWLLGALVAPGMWLQRITTREPVPDQIEVAIRALDGALAVDGAEAES
jgi:uncharacterized protein YqhQ